MQANAGSKLARGVQLRCGLVLLLRGLHEFVGRSESTGESRSDAVLSMTLSSYWLCFVQSDMCVSLWTVGVAVLSMHMSTAPLIDNRLGSTNALLSRDGICTWSAEATVWSELGSRTMLVARGCEYGLREEPGATETSPKL